MEDIEANVPVQHALKQRVASFCRQHFPFYSLPIVLLHISMYYAAPLGSKAFNALAFINGGEDYERGQIYRWYTYSLAHLNGQHIALNAICTLLYGILIEFDNAAWRCLLIHTASIIAGALGCGWEYRVTGNAVMLIGSSGGVYGLLASQAGNLIVNWPELTLFRRMVFTSVLVSVSITEALVGYFFYSPTISYSTHVGGFIAGLLAGGCLTTNIRKLPWERAFRIACWTGLSIYLLAGAINVLIVPHM